MNHSQRLFNRGFVSLLCTQFLGAANDNLLKQLMVFMVATGIWADTLGAGGQSVPALCLTLPFIFLSGLAGQLADRYSKRSVMVVVKIAEVPIALLALVGLALHSLPLTLASLLLMAIQSSFFGPAKFGVVPELVAEDRLSQANGTLNMFSNLAVILGSLLAGPLSVMFDPKDGNSLGLTEAIPWAPGAALLVIALAGLASVQWMPACPPANPRATISPTLFGPYLRSFAEMQPALLTVMLAWSGFYMIAMMALMIVPEYEQILDIDYAQASLLMGVLAVAVALGSALTGFLSGRHIRPKLIPGGGLGMTVCFLALGLSRPSFGLVAALIAGVGFSAGFYIVPLQALLQFLSPPGARGRFLGTANAMSLTMASAGAGFYWVLTSPLQMNPHRVHLVCGTLALAGCLAGTLRMRRILREMARERDKAQLGHVGHHELLAKPTTEPTTKPFAEPTAEPAAEGAAE